MNENISEQRDDDLAEAILSFLEDQPRAVTIEEIVEWWLARQPVQIDLNAVARAVNHLIERDILEGVGEGRSRRYRLKIEGKNPE